MMLMWPTVKMSVLFIIFLISHLRGNGICVVKKNNSIPNRCCHQTTGSFWNVKGHTLRFTSAGIGHLPFIANTIWYQMSNVPAL